MATAALISTEEYLRTTWRPDCDYVDGELVERNVGGKKHARTQREIIYYLMTHYPALRERILPEQRVQVKTRRFRVPNVCILPEDASDEEIVTSPPALCIEILSVEDTLARLTVRIKDYFELGVPICWVVDPIQRLAWIATPGHLDEALDGILRAGEIEMPLAAVLE